MKTDVMIAGAGPTGLALACQLIRFDVDFVIIDEKAATTPHSKALGVQARTLEIYDQLGIAGELVEQGAIAEKARLVEGGEVRGEIDLTNIGGDMSPFPFLLIVEQGRHEKILHDFIRSSGREVRWNTRLDDFTQTESGVTASVKNERGAVETIEAEFLVGCDGAKSDVRRRLGMTFEGSTFERLFYVADTRVEWKFSHDAIYICLAENTISAFFPMPGAENRFRIVGTFPENETRREGEILYEEIERQIKQDVEIDLDIHDVNWFSVYRVHSRRVNKFSEGRCFLAGDAAHIHTPAGAQGMNTGIQDGYNLAWKLAFVLRGHAGARLLETYNEERLPVAKRLLQTTDRVFDFGASEEWFVSFFRTKIFPYIANFVLHFDNVKRFVFPIVSQIGINYRKSSLSSGSGDFAVRTGDRMPYFTIDGASVYEKLKAPKFHLLAFFDGQTRLPDYAAELRDLASLVDFREFPLYPTVAEMFGISVSFVVLLRPDNHIGMISASGAPAEIRNYFGAIFGGDKF